MSKKIVIFGGSGLVGTSFIENTTSTLECIAPSHADVDVLNTEQVLHAIEQHNPDCILNAVGYTSTEQAEDEKDNEEGLVYQLNTKAAEVIASAAKQFSKPLVHLSTEYVFSGEKVDGGYTEDDPTGPINW